MPSGRIVVEERQLTSSAPHRVDRKTKLLTIFVVSTNVLGNFAMSWGLKHQAVDLGLSPLPYIRLIFTPWVLLGTTLLILWLLSRMTLLGWADLSYVLPVTSIAYVFSAVLGKVFFGEQVTWQRWLGTAFIVVGIIFVGLTAANTTKQEPAR
jgi:drug/metabolite transporter (DMT)-like permease